jgi:hypothetical protein
MSGEERVATLPAVVAQPRWRKPLRLAGASFLAVFGFGLLILLVGRFCFGSTTAFMAWYAGEPYLVGPTSFTFESEAPGSEARVAVNIQNLTGESLTVVGADSPCDCVTVEGLPLSLQGRSSADIKLRIRMPSETGTVQRLVTFFTDKKTRPKFYVSLECNVASIQGSQ